jgi:hypothetical protein
MAKSMKPPVTVGPTVLLGKPEIFQVQGGDVAVFQANRDIAGDIHSSESAQALFFGQPWRRGEGGPGGDLLGCR